MMGSVNLPRLLVSTLLAALRLRITYQTYARHEPHRRRVRRAQARGRADLEGAPTTRHGELEQFAHSCIVELSASEPVTNGDYASFLGKFCRQSSARGPACPPADVSFSLLPADVQILFVGCHNYNRQSQGDCLQRMVDDDRRTVWDGPIADLCAESYPVMKASLLLISHQGNEGAKPGVGALSSSNAELRGVGNTEDRNQSGFNFKGLNKSKSAKEGKVEDLSIKNRGNRAPPSQRPTPIPQRSEVARSPPPALGPTLYTPSFSPTSRTSIPTDDSLNEIQSRLSSPAILASATVGVLLLVFGLLKAARSGRCRGCNLPACGSDKHEYALSGDASVSSEPSQLFQFSPRVDVSRDESDPAVGNKRRFFRPVLPRGVAKHDPLQQTRVPSIYAWKDKDKAAGEMAETKVPLGSEMKRSNREEDESRDGDSPRMYQLDVFAVEEDVSSSISSEASRKRFRSPIDLLFRRRGTLFSRSRPIGDTNDVDGVKSSSLPEDQQEVVYSSSDMRKEVVPMSSSRELRHENEILEVHGAAHYRNDKPWRTESNIAAETPRKEMSRNDSIEIIDEYLSPEIAQKFRDVDKMLTDGLQQFNDEDTKLAIGVEKLQAYIDSQDAGKNSFFDIAEQDSGSNNEPRSRPRDHGSSDEPTSRFTLESSHVDGQMEDEAENAMLKEIASHNESYESEDDDNDSVHDDRGMQEHVAPAWIHKRNAEAWKSSRSELSLPRNKFFGDSESQQSSLLPPRVDSLD